MTDTAGEESEQPSFAQPEPGWFFYDGINAEYHRAVASFHLPIPDAFLFPENYPSDPEEKIIFGEGSGEVAAHLIWLDAVHAAAVDAHRAGDEQAAGYWVMAASAFEFTPTYHRFHDHDAPNPWREEWIANAKRGDFSALEEAVDAARAAAAVTHERKEDDSV